MRILIVVPKLVRGEGWVPGDEEDERVGHALLLSELAGLGRAGLGAGGGRDRDRDGDRGKETEGQQIRRALRGGMIGWG